MRLLAACALSEAFCRLLMAVENWLLAAPIWVRELLMVARSDCICDWAVMALAGLDMSMVPVAFRLLL